MDNFIPNLHKTVRQSVFTHRGATHHPKDVPVGLHKSYPRMEQYPLPQPESITVPLDRVLNERHSYFGGSPDVVIPMNVWGTLLGSALKKRQRSTSRNYPSGGALYPVETYVIGSVVDAKPAAFHYNPETHALEKLWDLPNDVDAKQFARYPEDLFFSALLVFTCVWRRSSAKYGDLAYSHGLLEAGHMAENVLLAATALNLLSRPSAGFNDELIIKHLDLDPEEEQPVHSILLSMPPL